MGDFFIGPPSGSVHPLIVDIHQKMSPISFRCVKICRHKPIEKLDIQKSLGRLDFILQIAITVDSKRSCICIYSTSAALELFMNNFKRYFYSRTPDSHRWNDIRVLCDVDQRHSAITLYASNNFLLSSPPPLLRFNAVKQPISGRCIGQLEREAPVERVIKRSWADIKRDRHDPSRVPRWYFRRESSPRATGIRIRENV